MKTTIEYNGASLAVIENGQTATILCKDRSMEANVIVSASADTPIPTYHYVEAGRVANEIAAFKEAHPNRLMFGVVSDVHVYNDDPTYEESSKDSSVYSSFALETVGAMTGCDFIVNLGDNCWQNGIDTEQAYLGAEYAIRALVPAFERLSRYNLVGNHDKSDDTQKQYDLIGSWNVFSAYASTRIRGFGYTDYTDKNVRVIVLNTNDYLNASGGCAMSYEQKDFLMRALDLSGKTNAAAWQILLLSHIPLDWNGGDYNFYPDLQAIFKAYEDGTTAAITVNTAYALNENPSTYPTYSNGQLVYDYSGRNVAKIIANIHGHVHTNKVGKIANTKIARVATANTNPNLNKVESYPAYGDYSITQAEANKIVKVLGTAKDTSATFYCIDLDTQKIYSIGYGADVNREIIYNEATVYTVTYSLSNVTSSNSATAVIEGSQFVTMLSPASGYIIDRVIVTMGGTDITTTAYADGAINIAEVTGDVVITAAAVTSYTNIIDTAGTEDNVRLRSSGATASGDGFVSGYFPVQAGDIIRVWFPNGSRASIPSNGAYCFLYSDNAGTVVTSYDAASSSSVVQNLTDTGYEIHIPDDKICSYARVAGGAAGQYAGWVVTVNQEITGG